MSAVYTKVIDSSGDVESVAEAKNAHNFHVAIWSHLLRKYELAPLSQLPTLDLRVLGKLWSRAAKLERADGLVLAATFDRCWFPREETVLRGLVDALRAASYAPTALHVANCINHVDWRDGDRGIAFASSLASPWACNRNEDANHVVNDEGHACKLCSKRIQHAIHMLGNLPCCREDEEATYAAD